MVPDCVPVDLAGVAYSTLLYLAGLQTIDNEIYEAARSTA